MHIFLIRHGESVANAGKITLNEYPTTSYRSPSAAGSRRGKTWLPYIFHPFRLAEQMDDEISTVSALLHNVVEDTEYTIDDIAAMSYPKEVTDTLALLTHEEGVPYMNYVEKICGNATAKK